MSAGSALQHAGILIDDALIDLIKRVTDLEHAANRRDRDLRLLTERIELLELGAATTITIISESSSPT